MTDKDLKQIEEVASKLRALGYIPRCGFLEAWDKFKSSLGLRHVKTEDVIEHLDFVCQVEQVGPYARKYCDC